jgi:hypothetical protein
MKVQLVTFILFICISLSAQDTEKKEKNWTFNGYLKYLHTVAIAGGSGDYFSDQLIHNRLRFAWQPSTEFTFKAALRTRLFYGDGVRATPNYAEFIESGNNDFIDASIHLANKPNYLFNTTMDRFYMEYVKNDWEIRLGRQRISWGINTIWNPNDIFNPYAFADFDYEERPGSDALRIKKYIGFTSSIEFAAKAADQIDETVMAFLYKWNKKQIDFQVLAGIFEGDYVLGGGWTGNVKNAGFKGEVSWFIPWDNDKQSVAAMVAVDKSLKSGLIATFGYLFNSNGQSSGSVSEIFAFELSAKNLYPYKHSLLFGMSVPVNPLINGSLNFIYSPGPSHGLFINPSLGWTLSNAWDFNFVAQTGFSRDADGKFNSPISALFLRFKNSF